MGLSADLKASIKVVGDVDRQPERSTLRTVQTDRQTDGRTHNDSNMPCQHSVAWVILSASFVWFVGVSTYGHT